MNYLYAAICFLGSILALRKYLYLEYLTDYSFGLFQRLGLWLLIIGLLYLSSYFFVKKYQLKTKRRIMRITMNIIFIYYLVLLVTLTLFDSNLRMDNGSWSFEKMLLWFRDTCNLKPFKMMRIYYYGLQDGLISLKDFLMNYLGNLLLLVPLGLLLPIVDEKYQNFFRYLSFSLSFIICIELLQGITMTGYCDIDDVILNTLGSILSFVAFSIDPVKILLRNIAYGQTKE